MLIEFLGLGFIGALHDGELVYRGFGGFWDVEQGDPGDVILVCKSYLLGLRIKIN